MRGNTEAALRLPVAQVRLEGEVTEAERQVLVRLASALGITGDDFDAAYTAGLQQADKIRKSRRST